MTPKVSVIPNDFTPSAIESAVIDKIKRRAFAGQQKYGKTMERGDLTPLEWLNHAQEEAMDLAVYLERLISKPANPIPPTRSSEGTLPEDDAATERAWSAMRLSLLQDQRDNAVAALESKIGTINLLVQEAKRLEDENAALRERVKRLEEAGDRLDWWCDDAESCKAWRKAKEAKP